MRLCVWVVCVPGCCSNAQLHFSILCPERLEGVIRVPPYSYSKLFTIAARSDEGLKMGNLLKHRI
jgi:hypothetical protein